MTTLLEQLKTMTVVVADTGDIDSIAQFKPQDATTNPSLIKAAAEMPAYNDIVNGALDWAQAQHPAASNEAIVALAVDRLAVEFGKKILELIPGRVSTEVDARLSYDTKATVDKARFIIDLYKKDGIDPSRILIKIAATWEGIEAAHALEQEGIACNLTLMFGLHQAAACAEANVTLISPFVGRILDWYKANHGVEHYEPADDPGVQSVTEIYNYYKRFGYKTEIMGASFRNLGQITQLAGCDLLTIAPKFLTELQQEGELVKRLDAQAAEGMTIKKLQTDEESFRAAHDRDAMAKEKLHEGIEKFSAAIEDLEASLLKRLQAAD